MIKITLKDGSILYTNAGLFFVPSDYGKDCYRIECIGESEARLIATDYIDSIQPN